MANNNSMNPIKRRVMTAAQAAAYVPSKARSDELVEFIPVSDNANRLDVILSDGASGLSRSTLATSAQGATSIQRGTSTLVAGVSPVIAATITATSRIVVTRNGVPGAAIGQLSATDRAVGAPGSFRVRAYNAAGAAEAADIGSFDYVIIN